MVGVKVFSLLHSSKIFTSLLAVSVVCWLFEFVIYFVCFSCLTFCPFFVVVFIFGDFPSGRWGF